MTSHQPQATSHYFSWQGYSLHTPLEWNAVKLEGNRAAGVALLADMDGPRAGLRWTTLGEKFDPAESIRKALRDEVGKLAADESIDAALSGFETARLYLEPEPPGRDVWIGFNASSRRMLQITYHAATRDRVLQRKLLPTLVESPADAATQWAVLDVSCETPARFELSQQHLSAGDLRLLFARGRERRVVRQIGPAELALSRLPLEKWLNQHPLGVVKFYGRSAAEKTEIDRFDSALKQTLKRRPRFFLQRRLVLELTTIILHDKANDRMVIVEADTADGAIELAKTIGWARKRETKEIAAAK